MSIKLAFKKNIKIAKGFIYDLSTQWHTPAKGNYVAYKEIINYSIGGMGDDLIMLLANYVMLSSGNMFFGMVLGLRPMHIQTMSTILMLINPLLAFLRAAIMDNAHSKLGKYKPFILFIGTPFFLICAVFMFLPFEVMTYMQKLAIVGMFGFAVNLLRPYMDLAYDVLGNVLTPNTKERSIIFTIKAFIFSLAPTIYGLLIPILSGFFQGSYTNINLYRFAVVPISFIGVFLSLFSVFGCKERFVQPKDYVEKSNVFENILQVYKNKYWWIRQSASWLGFLESASTVVFSWMYIYGSQNMIEYGILGSISGESATIAMFITPFLLATLGDRNLLVLHNGLNILFITFMLFTFKNPVAFFLLYFLNRMVNYLTLVYNPVMSAETSDYQQYISGKRIDASFGPASFIGLPIGIASGYVIPYVYELLGITTNFDIMFDPYVRNSVFTVLCALSIIGATLNLIPFCFFDMSRSKHEYIIKVLKLRAIFEDKISNNISPSQIVEVVENHLDYERTLNSEIPDIKQLKHNITLAKKQKNKQNKQIGQNEENSPYAINLKLAKKEYAVAKKLIADKKVIDIYAKELVKYDGDFMHEKLVLAKEITKFTPDQLLGAAISDFDFTVATLKASKENKKLIRYRKHFIKNSIALLKLVKKHYSKQILCPSQAEIDKAHELPHSTQKEIQIRFKAIKKLVDEKHLYKKTLRFYDEQQHLVNLSGVSSSIDLIIGEYDEALQAVNEVAQLSKEKEKDKKAQKLVSDEKSKQERFEKLSPKKQGKALKKRALKAERLDKDEE